MSFRASVQDSNKLLTTPIQESELEKKETAFLKKETAFLKKEIFMENKIIDSTLHLEQF